MAAIRAYERPLAERLIAGLTEIPGVALYGITDLARFDPRAPMVAFRLGAIRHARWPSDWGRRASLWDLRYYALAVTERLGVEESGAMVRVGIAHYNMIREVERLLAVVNDLARR
jgi:selenocysteine lyase/cysteine desulfurase